jgi:hypothetical protein
MSTNVAAVVRRCARATAGSAVIAGHGPPPSKVGPRSLQIPLDGRIAAAVDVIEQALALVDSLIQ